MGRIAREGEGPEPDEEHLDDILAIIESAKSRAGGVDALEEFVRQGLPEATDDEIEAAAEVALEIIESVPVFLARARQEAEDRGLAAAKPLLDRAERYYLRPIDLLPEMTHGLPGLLDDSYLVIRTLEHLDRGPEPFLGWDFSHPMRFLRRILGTALTRRLDAIVVEALEELSSHLEALWKRSAHRA